MKRILSTIAMVAVLCAANAQKVSETVTLYGKEQLNGFTINIHDVAHDIVEGAIVDKFENNMNLKGKKNKGYHVYMNQPCPTFGESRYDIYFTTQEVGKKKNRSVQVTLVVSTGNQNCITYSNDPRTARNITYFLENLDKDVQAYAIKLKIDELKAKIATLEKERESLTKEQTKITDKLNKTNDNIKDASSQIITKNAEITQLQEKYTESHDPAIKEQIAKTTKETQTLQKSQTSMRKSLLGMNNDLEKVRKKIGINENNIEKTRKELKEVESKR
ncbi:MAG: hypothetical protein SPL42_08250 [Bacteroidales bacterium]|nr:hypothetical protein [Bacteroidales bacterium]MDY6348398.1 hypothetical protein [Bacteroidales bacterium]